LSGELPNDRAGRPGAGSANATVGAGTQSDAGCLCLRRAAADEARDGEGRGRLPSLWALRRTVPDGRVGYASVRSARTICGASATDRDTRLGGMSLPCHPASLGMTNWLRLAVSGLVRHQQLMLVSKRGSHRE